MGGARAAVAGMLAAAVLVLSSRPVPEEPADTIRGLGALLAVIALLVGVDVWEAWRRRDDR